MQPPSKHGLVGLPILLCGQHRVDALLLQQDYDELRRLRRARVAPDRVNIVRTFVKSLPWRQGNLLAAPDLLDDRSFQHVDDSTAPGGYSTVIITIYLPGMSARSFCMTGTTTGCGAVCASDASGAPPARINVVPSIRRYDMTDSANACKKEGFAIRRPLASGGAIRRDRDCRGAPRPSARASAPRPARPSIEHRGRTQSRAGRGSLSDSGR